jgi:hypothetical protein
MKGASRRDAGALFYPLRPSLVRVADRMPGSVADAEDVVQHAFPRWFDVDRGAVREPAAFLRRVVTRLCRPGYFARDGPIARSEGSSTCFGVTLGAPCSASSANRSHVRAMSMRMD